MFNAVPNIMCVALVLLCHTAHAQQDKATFPNVLIIGDEVYQQFARGAVAELKGRANVVIAKWPADELSNSTNAIAQIDHLLGLRDAMGKDVPEAKRPVWKLVHLNVGLGDLIYRVPGLKSQRSLPHDFGGVLTTTPDKYEQNLDILIDLIKKKAPTAKIVWASTTPIRSSNMNYFRVGSEIEYNQIAARVMKKHNVPINDMHAFALGLMSKEKPAPQDPFFFDGKPIHPALVEVFVRELNIPLK